MGYLEGVCRCRQFGFEVTVLSICDNFVGQCLKSGDQ